MAEIVCISVLCLKMSYEVMIVDVMLEKERYFSWNREDIREIRQPRIGHSSSKNKIKHRIVSIWTVGRRQDDCRMHFNAT